MNVKLIDLFFYKIDYISKNYYFNYDCYDQSYGIYKFDISIKNNNNVLIELELSIENNDTYHAFDYKLDDMISYIINMIDHIYNTYIQNERRQNEYS